jgi:hypothetical protein
MASNEAEVRSEYFQNTSTRLERYSYITFPVLFRSDRANRLCHYSVSANENVWLVRFQVVMQSYMACDCMSVNEETRDSRGVKKK